MALRLSVPALLALLLLLVPSCSVLERTTDEDEGSAPPPQEEPAQPEEPEAPEEEEPAEDEEAPAKPRTVQGYRIQILTTEDKTAANQRAAEAEAQWGQPVEIAWKAPYYRVRVGAFASRSAAQSTFEAVKEKYADALLVPDTVTIYPD